jgi:hypothetical protein
MMGFYTGLLIGLLIGFSTGAILMALCQVAGQQSELEVKLRDVYGTGATEAEDEFYCDEIVNDRDKDARKDGVPTMVKDGD